MSVHEMRATASRRDLLKHSFYTRWTRGELTLDELRDYAGQYSFVVGAMPTWLDRMAETAEDSKDLRDHAREETAHIAMWADFASALGVDGEALAATEPNLATQALLDAGDDLVEQGNGAAALWALESQTPAVSVEKLQGLDRHYGIRGGSGTRYFEVHRTMDVRHTAELEALVDADADTAAAAPAASERMLASLWDLLTSVEREPVPA